MFLTYFLDNPIVGFVFILSYILGVAVHEFAHAKVADNLGDPTPRSMGRVTLNPLAHLDLMGSLAFLFFGFGWGKPVYFDPFNLKNPRKDSAFISLSGPLANFILIGIVVFIIIISNFLPWKNLSIWFFLAGQQIIFVNLILAFFNLIPVYPLDGFKILEGFLPEKKAREWSELRRYGLLFLFLLIFPIGNTSLAGKIISPLVEGTLYFIIQFLKFFV